MYYREHFLGISLGHLLPWSHPSLLGISQSLDFGVLSALHRGTPVS